MKRLFIFLMVLSGPGWAQPEPARAERLRPVLNLLQRLQVKVYRDQDWCQCFQYSRGTFMRSSHESTCGLFSERSRPFDGRADLDFRKLARTRKNCGLDFYWVTARYAQNRIAHAEFALAGWSRTSYHYQPGYQLPPDEGRHFRYRRINKDFYLCEED
ncbi:hypothetical protein JST97_03270 [bacterium]|nr:hypothetical protein [bacterium]